MIDKTLLNRLDKLSQEEREIEISTLIEIKINEIGRLKTSNLPFIKAKVLELTSQIDELITLTMNNVKMTFEQFEQSLEHREKEIYVPSLNGSINKVACMRNGILDHNQVKQDISNAYIQYLSR